MKFVVTLQCSTPTEDWCELIADFATEEFTDFCNMHLVCFEGQKIHKGEDPELKDTELPERKEE